MKRQFFFFLIFSVIFSGGLLGQNFHRNYLVLDANEKITVLDAKGLDNGNTLVLLKNIITTPDTVTTNIVVSIFNPKGNEVGSNQFDIANAIDGQLLLTEKDTFLVVNTENGLYTVRWPLNTISNPGVRSMHETNDIFGNNPFHLSANQDTFYLGTNAQNMNGSFISLSRYNDVFEPMWYKSMSVQDSFGLARLGAVHATADTTMVMTGTLNDTSYFVNFMDLDGEQLQSYRYIDTSAIIRTMTVISQAALPDSSVVLIGNYLSQTDENNGFIVSINKLGAVEWSKSVSIPGSSQTSLNNIISDWDNGVIISGMHQTDDLYPFSLKLTRSGEDVWQKQYNRMPGDFMKALFNTSDRAAGIFYQDTTTQDHLPSFIKMDTNGSSTCEEDIVGEIYTDLTWISDTLIWETEDYNIPFVGIDTIQQKRHQYNLPITKLAIDIFCPGAPIDHLFDPDLNLVDPANVTYLWSTGATTDTLRVFDLEQYILTTTINERVCFTLCDTVQLLEYGAPIAQLSLLKNRFCEENVLEIAGFFSAEAGIKSIVWSTGAEDVDRITITEIGTYSVTMIDNCDQQVTQTLNVERWPKRVESVTITPAIDVDCFLGRFTGRLTAMGDAIDLDQTYVWSNGATGSVLTLNAVTEPQYSVTVTDECGDTAEATVTLNLNGPGVISANINRFKQGDCQTVSYGLNAVANQNGNFIYVWSTGATTPNINVTTAGTYSVTITDVCGNTVSTTTNLSPVDFEPEKPTANITFTIDSTNTCQKVITLQANGQRANDTMFEYLWNNGSRTQTIEVLAAGTYTVTVTDICGNTVVANVTLTLENFAIQRPTIVINTSRDSSDICNPVVIITAEVRRGADTSFEYSWSNRATTSEITIEDPGTYTVIVTDTCGNTATASVIIPGENFDLPKIDLDIKSERDTTEKCNIQVTLTTEVRDRGSITSYSWSNGAANPTIIVNESGTYTVTVTDICGTTATKSITEDPSKFAPQDLKYAHVFFPNGMRNSELNIDSTTSARLVYNRFFGPVQSTEQAGEFCFELIEDYEFYVFNRWGQKVFESRRIVDEWDGSHNGRESASDTYTWVVRYKVLGVEKILKGDITMIRQ